MKFCKLYDAVKMTFCGFALITKKSTDRWIPRYDPNGEIYMWMRERV